MADKRNTCRLFFNIREILCVYVIICSCFCHTTNGDATTYNTEDDELFSPTVFIAILVRNKAHILPWFFGHLENLNYPKDKLALWIRSDHNIDNSTAMVQEWLAANEHLYNYVEFVFDDKHSGYDGEKGPCHWTMDRFSHVIQLREKAIQTARLMWADYILMLDADVIIENENTLNILIAQQKTLIAPMMLGAVGDTYSNFWGGMSEDGYYKRVPDYFKILENEINGTFAVPMIHSIFLMDLRHKQSESLSYIPPPEYNKPEDDIIIFSFSAAKAGVPMYVMNTEYFGQIMVPLDEHHSLYIEEEQFTYMRIETLDYEYMMAEAFNEHPSNKANPDMGPGVDYIIEGQGLRKSPHIHAPLKHKDSLGFDKVYMINLERRSERRERMLHVFDILGIEAELIPAVDGKTINASYIEDMEIKVLPGFTDPVKGRLLNDTYLYQELKIEVVPGFTDPYGGRPMTMGEIGCFLSHYFIWLDMVKKGYSEVVVFEDDLRFEPYFRTKLANIMRLVDLKVPNWDLIYLGRKRLNRKDEYYLHGTDSLVWPSYSYWTLSYLLSSRGAKKLLAQNPLQKLLPVDEYLPVMFNKHPEESWKEPFQPRDLIALSAEPLLIYPTHYLGEPNYISDTEWSELITEKTNHNSAEEPQKSPMPGTAPLKPKDNGIEIKGEPLNPTTNNRQQDEL